jgi:hypothetical protein
MIAVILSAAVALLSHSTATPARTASSAHTATVATSANLPAAGKVIPGQSIGGVSLGMTEAQVVKIWGPLYEVCTRCGKQMTWLYEYRGEVGSGAAIKFNIPSPAITSTGAAAKLTKKAAATAKAQAATARVVAVFTLGQPQGWGVTGAMIGDPPTNVYQLFGNTGNTQCIGYSAMTVDIGGVITSFYSSSGVIYGFALTNSNESPCE